MAVHHSIARPSDAVEMQFAALRNCHRDLQVLPAGHHRDVTRGIVASLPRASSYFWSKDCSEAVWASSVGVPNDACVEDDLCLASGAFWWFNSPLPNYKKFDELNDGVFALHLMREGTFICINKFGLHPTHGPMLIGGVKGFDVGTALSTIEADESSDAKYGTPPSKDERSIWRFAMAAQVWLRQKIAIQSETVTERHCRKRIAKEFQVEAAGLHVVQLRRSESAQSSTDGSPAEWSCQWLVRGHWRNQPYKAGKRLIFIAPYIKGPEDKPLKAPMTTVFSVSR